MPAAPIGVHCSRAGLWRRRDRARGGVLRFARAADGAAAVEFALAFPFLLMLLLGIFEFGEVFWVRNTLQYATEQTTRYAMTHVTASANDLATYLKAQLPSLNPNSVDVQVSAETLNDVNYVTVVATYGYAFGIPFVALPTLTLTGQSRVPLT